MHIRCGTCETNISVHMGGKETPPSSSKVYFSLSKSYHGGDHAKMLLQSSASDTNAVTPGIIAVILVNHA